MKNIEVFLHLNLMIKITGIIIAFLAVYFTSKKEKTEAHSSNIVLPALLFIGAGIIDTSMNYIQHHYIQVEDTSMFTCMTFAFAFIFGLLYLGYNCIKTKEEIKLKNIIAGFALGIPNYYSMFFLIKALQNKNLESATIFTLINIGVILLTTIFSIFLFKEKLQKAKDYSWRIPSVFVPQMAKKEYAFLQEKMHRYKGFYIQKRSIRNYQTAVGANVLGSISEVNDADFSKFNAHGELRGMEFQNHWEKQAFKAEGSLVAPAQRMEDFLNQKTSSTLPSCSYIPGISAHNLWDFLPEKVARNLREAIQVLGQKKKWYKTNEAVLVGVESRTSSPVRIPRNEFYRHPEVFNMLPCAEGAGYAGGILSAALDGINCIQTIEYEK